MGLKLTTEAEALWRETEAALSEQRGTGRVLRLLVQLARVAPLRSEPWRFAHEQLAAQTVHSHPWRASVAARQLVEHDPQNHAGWAHLGLAQSLLGNHRYAITAYRRAIRLAPANPWYAHNLGHLIDVALDDPERAVPLLERALAQLPVCLGATRQMWNEVAASYSHALMKSGRLTAARAVMIQVVRGGAACPSQQALYQEIVRQMDEALASLMEALEPECLPRRRTRVSRRTKLEATAQ